MVQPVIPILAAGIGVGSIITFLVIAAYVLSWLNNVIQSSNPKGPKPKNKPRPNAGGQTELERFLQEVSKKNSGDSDRPANAKPKPPEKKKQKAPAPQPQAQRPSPPQRPGARMAESRLPKSTLGDGLRTHLATMETRSVDNQVRKDIAGNVRKDIDERVQKDMGTDSTAIAMDRKEVVHPLMVALRNPQGVRQAVLLTEILNRPKSLRNH